MKSLTDTQASDERLWAGMCHSDFWGYLKKRWNNNDRHAIKENNIKQRFFFGKDKKRSLFTNSLAKLWWVGRLTYDNTRTDPFELTKYLENDCATKTLVIFSNNYMSSHNISVSLLSALKKLDDDGYMIKGKLKRDLYYEATKYLNVLRHVFFAVIF